MAKAQDVKRGSLGGERIEALQESMNEHGVDLVVVGPTTNLRYLTGMARWLWSGSRSSS